MDLFLFLLGLDTPNLFVANYATFLCLKARAAVILQRVAVMDLRTDGVLFRSCLSMYIV